MIPKRSDIPLASAEKLAAKAPQNMSEREKAFAAAYHLKDFVTVDLSEPLDWVFRQMLLNYANSRWGFKGARG